MAGAPGQAGWSAEMLRYASYWLEDEHGNRKKFWILAPLLTNLLNAFFLSGSGPACVTSGLVSPIHKKGCPLYSANYRPIAVGEPLYKLHTTILNDRLVRWSEEHGLLSLAKAGLRPGSPLPTTSLPCGMSSTMRCSPSAPCMSVLWISKRPMTVFSMYSSGRVCRSDLGAGCLRSCLLMMSLYCHGRLMDLSFSS